MRIRRIVVIYDVFDEHNMTMARFTNRLRRDVRKIIYYRNIIIVWNSVRGVKSILLYASGARRAGASRT